MRGGLRASLVGLLSLGCYLSHARPDDAGPVSIDARDAGPDAPLDAPLPRCERIVIGETAALDGEALGSVTPRLVGLPDGSVAVVSVRTDGAPTRVLYEVRDAALRALEPSRTLATDSFTWAELTRVDERVVAALAVVGPAGLRSRNQRLSPRIALRLSLVYAPAPDCGSNRKRMAGSLARVPRRSESPLDEANSNRSPAPFAATGVVLKSKTPRLTKSAPA